MNSMGEYIPYEIHSTEEARPSIFFKFAHGLNELTCEPLNVLLERV